ncbi:MAG: hypothetical protein LBB10_01500, partial [Bifidobacteriaceae bacterium]|nr:hypothetical protein [Bifidobacteriaceae bacterium]
MMIVKNAWRSIRRAKGRNILIGIIIFTIATTSTIALSILKAANDAKASGLENTKITAQISPDRQKLMSSARSSGGGTTTTMEPIQIPELTLDQLESYSKLEGVESFYYTNTASLSSAGTFPPVKSSDNSANSAPGGGQARGTMLFGGAANADFTLTGYSSSEAMSDFIDGSKTITEGGVFKFTDGYECIISSTLAAQNSTKVGDTITLKNPLKSSETYKLKVTGIYKSTEENQTSGPMPLASADPANAVYASASTISAIVSNSAKNPETSTTEGMNGQNREQSSKMNDRITGTYVLPSKEAYDQFG